MTRVLIATFSQTGSIQKVAAQIDKGLSASGLEVTHLKINGEKPRDISEYDIIGIGTPTYIFRPPFIVVDFVKNLKDMEGKPFFVFITHGTSQGDCGNRLRRKMSDKGGRDLGYFHCFGADYWMGYIKRGTLFSPGSPDEVELAHALKFGARVAARFISGSIETERFDQPTHFVYALERIFVARPLVKSIYYRTFYADKNCDLCGICIEKCPVNNIRLINDRKLKWDNRCLLCASCELSCPKDAIHSAIDWPLFAPFMRYNIWRSKKKGIPFVPVIHSQGKTVMMQ
jgi:flavodoxin/ferredoxin